MTLKELQKMIKEEYASFIKEQDEMPPMPGGPAGGPAGGPKPPTVNVSDKDVDLEGDDAEATLKKMFDMLKDFFEGEDDAEDAKPKPPKADDADDADDKKDKEDKEDEDADLEEGTAGNGFGKGAKEAKGSSGKMGGVYKESKRARNNKKMIAEARMKARFKTLANIKK
tara:strand:+ start:82 stop:588 length:507 start_codon:yes stop_codon:yes gene_type:complete